MLERSRKFPLRLHSDFFITAQKNRRAHFVVWYIPAQKTQVSVIVGKKVCAKATDRNAQKRKMYTIVEKKWPDLPIASLVVVLYSSAVKIPTQDLEQELYQAFDAIKNTLFYQNK